VDGAAWLIKLRDAMASGAQQMPTHRAYIDQHCKAAA
jgi:hypothetical protein